MCGFHLLITYQTFYKFTRRKDPEDLKINTKESHYLIILLLVYKNMLFAKSWIVHSSCITLHRILQTLNLVAPPMRYFSSLRNVYQSTPTFHYYISALEKKRVGNCLRKPDTFCEWRDVRFFICISASHSHVRTDSFRNFIQVSYSATTRVFWDTLAKLNH